MNKMLNNAIITAGSSLAIAVVAGYFYERYKKDYLSKISFYPEDKSTAPKGLVVGLCTYAAAIASLYALPLFSDKHTHSFLAATALISGIGCGYGTIFTAKSADTMLGIKQHNPIAQFSVSAAVVLACALAIAGPAAARSYL